MPCQTLPQRGRHPTTVGEHMCAMGALLTGGLVTASVFANMAHVVASAGSRLAKHREAMKLGMHTLTVLGVPLELQNKVSDWFDYVWFRHQCAKP